MSLPLLKVGYLTACVQTPPGTTPQLFIEDPRSAAVAAASKHLEFAASRGISTIELGAALAPADANVPPESMADPVAHHTPMRTHQDGTGVDLAAEDVLILSTASEGKVSIGTLGAFENLLHENPQFRRQNLEHVRRAIRAAAALREGGLGTEGVTIFVGRNLKLSIADNMKLVAEVLIPLVRYAKSMGVKLFIENCPMCGWSSTVEVFTQNIANNVLHWIMIARMIKAAGLKGWCFLNYDPSHDILQGTRPEWSFMLLSKAGYSWFIARFHGKDLAAQLGKIAMCGYIGQRVANGGNQWSKMCGDQPAPGATEHNLWAMYHGLQVDWLGMLISARENLELDVPETTFTVEFEQSEFRNPADFASQQDHWETVMNLIAGSVQYVQGVDQAAAANAALQNMVQVGGQTWNWQEMTLTASDDILTGNQPIIDQAEEWEMPELPETTELVLGSDLTAA